MLFLAHLNAPCSLFLQPFKLSNPTFIPTLHKTTPTLTCTSQPQPKRKPLPRNRPLMDGQMSTSKNRRKSSYGTSRRSILKKTFSQEQVTFTTPFPDDPVVGIIGGGMAGLICALNLEKRGVRSTIFDTVG